MTTPPTDAEIQEIQMTEQIKTKSQMYELLWNHQLGNHFPWMWFPEWLDSEYRNSGLTHSVRFGKDLGAPWQYHLSDDEVIRVVTDSSIPASCIGIVSMPVFIKPLLNAELMELNYRLELFCSTVAAVMRDSLRQGGRSYQGISAKAVIDHYCDPATADDLRLLLDQHPHAVIEFTVYDRNVGVIPHRNTVIWEVRNY